MELGVFGIGGGVVRKFRNFSNELHAKIEKSIEKGMLPIMMIIMFMALILLLITYAIVSVLG